MLLRCRINKCLPKAITCLLLCIFPATIFCQLPDDSVNLSFENENIEKVLEEITLQTGYFFTYDASLISNSKKTSVQAKNIKLKNALDLIFNNPELTYELIDKNIVIFKKNIPTPSQLASESDPTRLRIKGIVKDRQTGEKLPFATINIHNTRKGIIANLQGEFSFVYPAEKENPILVVSVIGYKNAYVHVNPDNADKLEIELEQNVISLQEVLIRYQNPVEIITSLRENIPSNYFSERSSMTAYFREYVQKNTDFITFSEAVIGIDKSPYNQFMKFDNVQVIRGRKMQNISREDSVLLKIQSGVNTVLQLDIIKNLPDFLSAEFANDYQYEFRNIVAFRNQYVYHIGFKPKEYSANSQYRGDLYINKDNYSLLSVEFEVDSRDLRKNPERFLIRKSRFIRIKPLKASYKVEYRSTESKYHLSMVRAEVKFRIRKKNEWIGSQYTIALELAVTEVDPETRTKIPRRQRLNPNTILSDEEFTYDPDFWGNYNIIEPEASLQSALKKMGIEWTDY